jgi:ankyrin repeat protein
VLLEHGAEVNARGATNRTPLHVASEYGYLDGTRLLLQHGTDIHVQDDNGRTPFHVAAAAADPDPDPERFLACQDIMKLLLEHGAKDHRTQ